MWISDQSSSKKGLQQENKSWRASSIVELPRQITEEEGTTEDDDTTKTNNGIVKMEKQNGNISSQTNVEVVDHEEWLAENNTMSLISNSSLQRSLIRAKKGMM